MPRKPSLIPAEIRAAATEALAAEEARRRAFREQVERDQRCHDAVKAFGDATNALWFAAEREPDKVRSRLRRVRRTLVAACTALAEAGRLDSWERIDHGRTYDDFRFLAGRVRSRPSYEWARQLLDQARAGQLPASALAQTWREESLRDAIRWLRVFVYGLSGEGAVLPVVREQLPQGAAVPRDRRGAGQGEVAEAGAGQVKSAIQPEDLGERECELLCALWALKAVGPRRSVLRRVVAKKADPAAKPASYNKAVASLGAKGLVGTKPGPGGGIWLTPAGEPVARSFQRSGG
jgi:hypothetical protein